MDSRTKKKVIIGTRGSDLALWQAGYLQNLLSEKNISSELKIIVTSGDKNQQWQNYFDKTEGKNFFTKEIEEALLKEEIDIAVHSFKDVEAIFSEDDDSPLIIAGLSNRHAANDILILHKDKVDKSMVLHISPHARIGTSSARRYAQLRSFRTDVEILPLRGNVPTRIEKLKKREYDGIILARAGVERLNISLDEFYVYSLPLHYFVPAAGQGIIAFQVKRDNEELCQLIKSISSTVSENCSKIERYIIKWIGGGCSKPIGVFCEYHHHLFRLYLSVNTDKEQTSIISILQEEDTEMLINKAKQNILKIREYLKHPCNKTIFVSKKLEENNYLRKVLKRLGWCVTDEPLIKTEKIEVKELPDSDWIFFNSKNAVKYFFELFDSEGLKNKKIGCVSSSTADYLQSKGVMPHFIGEGNDIQDIGKQFADTSKNQKVLFPCSDISNKSIGKEVELHGEAIYLPIYHTVENPKKFTDEFDCLVFTSPSNVRAYFKYNHLSSHSKIIAMGESTKREILKYDVDAGQVVTPVFFDDVGIAAALIDVME